MAKAAAAVAAANAAKANATASNATASNATVSNATASNATASNATASNATVSDVPFTDPADDDSVGGFESVVDDDEARDRDGVPETSARASSLLPVDEATLLRRADRLLREQRRYLRERKTVVERARGEWRAASASADAEPDAAERRRKRGLLAAVRGALDAQASHYNADARNLRALRAATRSVRAGATWEAAFSSTVLTEAPRGPSGAFAAAPSATSGTAGYGSGTDAETSRVAATLDRRRRADPRDEQFGGDPLKSLKSALAGVRAAEERRVETAHVARNVGGIYARAALGPDTSAPGGKPLRGVFARGGRLESNRRPREGALRRARRLVARVQVADRDGGDDGVQGGTGVQSDEPSCDRPRTGPATGVGASAMSEEDENGRVRTAWGYESTDAFATEMAHTSTGTAGIDGDRESSQHPAATKSRRRAYADIFNGLRDPAFPRPSSHSRSHSLVGRHPSGSIAVPFSAVFAHDGDRLSHDVAHGKLPGLRRHGHVQRDRACNRPSVAALSPASASSAAAFDAASPASRSASAAASSAWSNAIQTVSSPNPTPNAPSSARGRVVFVLVVVRRRRGRFVRGVSVSHPRDDVQERSHPAAVALDRRDERAAEYAHVFGSIHVV